MSEEKDAEMVTVIGHQWAPQVHMVKDVLARHRVPYEWLDLDRDASARELLESVTPGERRVPVVLLPDGTVLTRPSERELAEHIGLDTQPDLRFYDLVIVGGGPAGLAAAVYGASEGLRTVVVEREIPGGQAGTSASIENLSRIPRRSERCRPGAQGHRAGRTLRCRDPLHAMRHGDRCAWPVSVHHSG